MYSPLMDERCERFAWAVMRRLQSLTLIHTSTLDLTRKPFRASRTRANRGNHPLTQTHYVLHGKGSDTQTVPYVVLALDNLSQAPRYR